MILRKALLAIAVSGAISCAAATPATFPGGSDAATKYLAEHIKYPARSMQNGIEGVVTLSFTVGTDGKISNITVERPLDPDLEAEAVRVVRGMPLWVPATDDAGQPVSQTVRLPVKFRLPADSE